MKRRTFLKSTGALVANFAFDSGVLAQNLAQRKFLVTINMTGGWDVSSFCDPKLNVSGEPLINTWAQTKGILQEGNIPFADYGNNALFFSKHWQNILVINGVDSQTNSHGAATRASFTGTLREGIPTLSGLYASEFGSQLAMPHLSLGSGVTYSSSDLVAPITISNIAAFKSAIKANTRPNSSTPIFSENKYQHILNMKKASIEKIISKSNKTPGNVMLRESYLRSLSRLGDLEDFYNTSLPIAAPSVGFGEQVEIALMSFLSGQTIAADLGPVYSREGGSFSFDTHSNHDATHETYLSDALSGIDYLWTLAEKTGIADNLVVIVSSDFGRTPYYNLDGGKDHWPIGSTMIMEKNVGYTNRVVGQTDEIQNAMRINPSSLGVDNFEGIYLNTAHIQLALREYLGLSSSSFTKKYPLSGIKSINIFS
jgi:hypothetical protein